MIPEPGAAVGQNEGFDRPPGDPAAFSGHVFTIDLEDWFQVGAYETTIDRADWPGLSSRLDEQVPFLLDALAAAHVKATFFCLGWVGRTQPHLIRRIAEAGHEIACHGNDHRRLTALDPAGFAADLKTAKGRLEDVTGARVAGYRAPSFSLGRAQWWVYEELSRQGFSYSSSLYPVTTDHYGMAEAPTRPFKPMAGTELLEIPMTRLHWLGRNLPVSGGGYFRLMPYWLGKALFLAGARQNGTPGIFYMHPWEVDPDQPRVPAAPLKSRFRHRIGLRRMRAKVPRLMRALVWSPMGAYVAHLNGPGEGAS
ncbi:XrtA system polysaccharide deacetylase [Yunchengibacter salinarum]|uniref:XrtA system polysaccharide deacetylase n=1 Tax=Yunchengibacter salinarum TaxID=3133399 RepID=UPI0035B592A8